jgi:hypothetical protein
MGEFYLVRSTAARRAKSATLPRTPAIDHERIWEATPVLPKRPLLYGGLARVRGNRSLDYMRPKAVTSSAYWCEETSTVQSSMLHVPAFTRRWIETV